MCTSAQRHSFELERPDETITARPKVAPMFRLPDDFWEQLEPLLPKQKPRTSKGGRPPKPLRAVADAIYFVVRTGIQWKALPNDAFGVSGSTAHRYFQQWVNAGVFFHFWSNGLITYDQLKGIEWEWQSADGAMGKAPLAVRRPVPTRPTAARRAL